MPCTAATDFGCTVLSQQSVDKLIYKAEVLETAVGRAGRLYACCEGSRAALAKAWS
jgi:hypothetical protein